MGETIRRARTISDNQRVLDALLRQLCSKRHLSQEDLDMVLEITIKKVADAVKAQAITIFLVNDDRTGINFGYVYYATSLYGKDAARRKLFEDKSKSLKEVTLDIKQGIVGKVIESSEPYFAPDVRQDPNFFGGVDSDTGFVTRSMITVPLVDNGETIGAIQVLNKSESGQMALFQKYDLALLEEVASYSAKVFTLVNNPEIELSERDLAQYIARLSKCEFMILDEDFEAPVELLETFGQLLLRRDNILPLEETGTNEYKVAMAKPMELDARKYFELKAECRISSVVVAAESDIKAVMDKVWAPKLDTGFDDVEVAINAEFSEEETTEKVEIDDDANEESAPIVQLASRLIEDAYKAGASDIHVEPFEHETIVRYRIDGELAVKLRLPPKSNKALIARYKVMAGAGMDIAERRLPQDGRIQYKQFNKKGIDVDLRVSTAPMSCGEKICMRILDKAKSALPLEALGFSAYNLKAYRNALKSPYGMILHCGPTGSGKSMTLFSALGEISTPNVNISTAEDPIEYTIHGINQMQMQKQIGLTFATALRCYLRQDPDIILVGETRDLETAEIAVEAALTGHLLFSTLHTNDAPTTISRFMEMGIEPFMISSSIVCVCAQRLIRRVCQNCAEQREPEGGALKLLERARDGAPIETVPHAVGCEKCGGSGYKGRLGTHELLIPNDKIRLMINERASAEEIALEARASGMITLFEDCMAKVKEGLTTMEDTLASVIPDEKEVEVLATYLDDIED